MNLSMNNPVGKILRDADILLIVPPFWRMHSQSLAMHILQAIAREQGFSAQVFYANIFFASQIGQDAYTPLERMSPFFAGERIFARAAYTELLESRPSIPERYQSDQVIQLIQKSQPVKKNWSSLLPSDENLLNGEQKAADWVAQVTEAIVERNYSIIGSTTSFEQTNSSLALLKAIKQERPETFTILGGFNCEGEMADGIASLDPEISFLDYIFSGESEETFTGFLKDFSRGILPESRILRGTPLNDLDSLPQIDYSDFFEQLYFFFPQYKTESAPVSLNYETSRGCAWGEKSACNFCGYEERLPYRTKSPEKILDDIHHLKSFPARTLDMTDLLMPKQFSKVLVPVLAKEEDQFEIYYELRVNLTYTELKQLYDGGLRFALPGIETLSDPVLHLMHKGTQARQNISFMRNATSLGINVIWNFLWAFPGEKIEYYRDLINLFPQLFHLPPPNAFFPLGIYRFSVYYRNPEKFGIQNIRPLEAYKEIFPPHADLKKISYYFKADYYAETFDHPEVMDELATLIGKWNEAWKISLLRPRLEIVERRPGEFSIIDTRGLPSIEAETAVTSAEAAAILETTKYTGSSIQQWALERKTALHMKNYFVPLVTISENVREKILSISE